MPPVRQKTPVIQDMTDLEHAVDRERLQEQQQRPSHITYFKEVELKYQAETEEKGRKAAKEILTAEQENKHLAKSLQEAHKQLSVLRKQLKRQDQAKTNNTIALENAQLKAEKEMLLQELEKVKQERDELTEALERKDAQLWAACSSSDVDMDTHDTHDAMRTTVQQLMGRDTHVSNVASSQESDTLFRDSQEVYIHIQNEKASHRMFQNSQIQLSQRAMQKQNNAMKQMLEKRKEEHNKLDIWPEMCKQRVDRIDSLKKENDKLIEQIQDLERKTQNAKISKHKNDELEAEVEILQKQNSILTKIVSKDFKKHQNQKEVSFDYGWLQTMADSFKQDNKRLSEEIKEKLGKQMSFQAELESLQAESNILKSRNKALGNELLKLKKELSKEQEQEAKNNLLKNENEGLRKDTCDLHVQLEEQRNKLKNKEVLAIIYDALKIEKDALSRQSSALRKELQRINKKLNREKALEGKCSAEKNKVQNLSRECRAHLQEIQSILDCSRAEKLNSQ